MDRSGNSVHIYPHQKTRYWQFSARGCCSPLAVHRFAAFQKFGELALAAECVRHLNDDRNDNSLSNIGFGTKSQNQFDIPQAKRSAMGVKRNAAKRRFSPDQVRAIRKMLASGWSLNRLRAEFSCSLGAIANIRDGRTYREIA